jgi:5-(carboxyamino)imidazole ribonucleotide synthase
MKGTIRLGIIGGGQLGKMLIQSAMDFNIEIHVLDGDAQAPCRPLAHHFTIGNIEGEQTVIDFGQGLDVVTVEIERISVRGLEYLQQKGIKVYPQPHALRIIQDKRLQKQFYAEYQIPTADFVLTENKEEVKKLAQKWLPAVHKIGKGGYDGKGVVVLNSEKDLEKAFDAPAVLEKKVNIAQEISVIVARGIDGQTSVFPPVASVFNPELNLVDYLIAPADISEKIVAEANELAVKIIEKLDMVGLLAVEFFLSESGDLLVNEVAPRPHNSGHHTIKACYTSQFEQHIRAICGLPLGNPTQHTPAAMINLLGEKGYEGVAHYEGMEKALQTDSVFVHLYGKAITKSGRKMGHITVLAPDKNELMQKITQLKDAIKVVAK